MSGLKLCSLITNKETTLLGQPLAAQSALHNFCWLQLVSVQIKTISPTCRTVSRSFLYALPSLKLIDPIYYLHYIDVFGLEDSLFDSLSFSLYYRVKELVVTILNLKSICDGTSSPCKYMKFVRYNHFKTDLDLCCNWVRSSWKFYAVYYDFLLNMCH